MSKTFWALGTLLELLIASRQLGKLYGARQAAEAGAFCPNDGGSLLAWACQHGLNPACTYIHANCEAPDDLSPAQALQGEIRFRQTLTCVLGLLPLEVQQVENNMALASEPGAPSLPGWAIALVRSDDSNSDVQADPAANVSAELQEVPGDDALGADATLSPCRVGEKPDTGHPTVSAIHATMHAGQQAKEVCHTPRGTPDSADWQEFDSWAQGSMRGGEGAGTPASNSSSSSGNCSSSSDSSGRVFGVFDVDGGDVGSGCSSARAGASRSGSNDKDGGELGMLSGPAAPALSAMLASALPWGRARGLKLLSIVQGALQWPVLQATTHSALLVPPLPCFTVAAAGAAAVVLVVSMAGLAILKGRLQQQQHLAGSSMACTTPMTAAAPTTPGTTAATTPGAGAMDQVDGYDYLDLYAWQRNDHFFFGGSTVRRSGRLAGRRGHTSGQTASTPAAVVHNKARADACTANEEEGGGEPCHSTGRWKAGEQEENVWVRRSRGSWLGVCMCFLACLLACHPEPASLGGVQSMLRSPTSAALITPNGPGLEELQAEEGGLEWSPGALRVLRLRQEPPAPFQSGCTYNGECVCVYVCARACESGALCCTYDAEAAAAIDTRQQAGGHPQRSTGKQAKVPALHGRTPARALRVERQSVVDAGNGEDGTPANFQSPAFPARDNMTTSQKAPRSRGQVFWA
eukprot:916119-Pelagomonas_calceolata.AAC.2